MTAVLLIRHRWRWEVRMECRCRGVHTELMWHSTGEAAHALLGGRRQCMVL